MPHALLHSRHGRAIHRHLLPLLLICLPAVAAAQNGTLVTHPAGPYVWNTAFVSVAGTDAEALIDHGSHYASRVERRMILRNIFTDTIRLDLRGSCGCDYYGATKERLAPGDSTEIYIGYDLSSRIGTWSKIVTLEIQSRTAAGEPWRPVERYRMISRGVRMCDVRFETYGLVLDVAVGKTIDTTVAIICTAPEPIDVRARFEAGEAGIAARIDDSPHHMRPGDTLRLPIRFTPTGTPTPGATSTATIRATTRHDSDEPSMYIMLNVRR